MTTTERGYDWQWRKLSERFRKEFPLCQECERQGRVTPCDEVHHIVPISEAPWLRLDRSNLMALCVACHDRIEAEARRDKPMHRGVG